MNALAPMAQGFQQAGQAAGAAAQAFVPFGQADRLWMDKLTGGLSQVAQQVLSGTIPGWLGENYKKRIQAQLQPLLQRQQQTQRQQVQQAHADAMQSAAMQQSINGVNMRMHAQNVSQSPAIVTNPLTGQSEMLYQRKPGEFHPVEYKGAAATREMMQPADGGPGPSLENYLPGFMPGLSPVAQTGRYGGEEYRARHIQVLNQLLQEGKLEPDEYRREMDRLGVSGKPAPAAAAQPAGYGLSGEPERGISWSAQQPPAPAAPVQTPRPAIATPTVDQVQQAAGAPPAAAPVAGATGGYGPATAAAPAATDNRHVMTIVNGQHVQKFAFNPSGGMETVYDSHPQNTEAGVGGFTESEVDSARAMAERMVGPMPPIYGQGPHAQMMRSQAAMQRMRAIMSGTQNILNWHGRLGYQNQGFGNRMEAIAEQARNKLEFEGTRQDNRLTLDKHRHEKNMNYWKAATDFHKSRGEQADFDTTLATAKKIAAANGDTFGVAPGAPAPTADRQGASRGLVNDLLIKGQE
jgi:hypothetical protein